MTSYMLNKGRAVNAVIAYQGVDMEGDGAWSLKNPQHKNLYLNLY